MKTGQSVKLIVEKSTVPKNSLGVIEHIFRDGIYEVKFNLPSKTVYETIQYYEIEKFEIKRAS
jgi:hypothetical protein